MARYWGIAVTDLTVLFLGGFLELWTRKAIECSKLGELFCGSLEDEKVERNVHDRGLACDVSRGKFESLLCHGHYTFLNDSAVLVSWGYRIGCD